MEQKIADKQNFIEKSRNYVAEIEKYSGDDPLDPWYRYMVWLEESYAIDFGKDAFFMDILCSCLAKFEADERYKQDRRLIKLFIKYISHQEAPEEHFDLMYTNGVGTRTSDLYICWAHWYNIAAKFERAEQIYQWGFAAKARPSYLLKCSHHAFGENMSKRILKKLDRKNEEKMCKHFRRLYNHFIRLNLDRDEMAKPTEQTLPDLPEFDRSRVQLIPFSRTQSAQPMTPERQSNASLIQTIVNSCSARKKRPESHLPSHKPAVSRLNFGDEEYPPIPLADADNMYARGIQLPKNWVQANLPQRMITVLAVRDDELASTESDELNLPMYDKIMLQPAASKAFSPEELRAYKWFKGKNIQNEFTAEMDGLWSVGWHVPLRRGEWFVERNMPQRNEVYQDEFFIDAPIAEGMWRFAFDIEQHHPTGGNDEFSREELLRQKRIKASSVAAKKPLSVLRVINRHKLKLPSQPADRLESSPMPSTSQQIARQTDYRPLDIATETTISDFNQIALERKTNRSEELMNDLPGTKKNRKGSYEFKELDDTCTTQMFGMYLKGQSASTPNPKLNHSQKSVNPRASMFVRQADVLKEEDVQSVLPAESEVKKSSVLPEPSRNAAVSNTVSMEMATEEKVETENLKFEIFIDETIAPGDVTRKGAATSNMNVEAKPEEAGFHFEIYRDETKVMFDEIRLNAKEHSPQATVASPAAPFNDENQPMEGLSNLASTAFKPIRPTTDKSDPSLRELNVATDAEKQLQMDYSFVMTETEKKMLLANPKKVDFSFDFEDVNRPKTVGKQPSIDEEEEEAEDNDLLGKSIYLPREEVVFSDAKHADWPEATLHLAEGDAAKNDYVVEPVDMNETLQIIDAGLLDLMKLSPFSSKLQKALLDSVSFIERLSKMDKKLCDMVNIVQPIRLRSKLTLGTRKFSIQKMIGSGNYGQVFSGECCHTKSTLALKQQRPPNLWEYYICLEVQKRLENQRIRNGCMSIEYALIGNNATIFASKFSSFGTLLHVCNQVKLSTGRNMDEYVVMILAKQMFAIVDALHRVKIIHGDIKPDNFLLMTPVDFNYDTAELALQLIDFGQSIDMKLFPKNQVFYSKLKTENFVCTEMMDDRPWTFQSDLFCLASTIYMMVCGEYMVVRKASKNSTNYTTRTIPRYYNKTLWTHLLDVLINIPDPQRLPNLGALSQLIDDEIRAVGVKAMRQKITEFNKALAK